MKRARLYAAILKEHCEERRQMAFLSGPREVGKTWVCRSQADACLDWDDLDHRRTLLGSPVALAENLGLDRHPPRPPVAVFDELPKHLKWKALLRGFFDVYGERAHLLVAGSSGLDELRQGDDFRLEGRYQLYRMHPWSVGECVRTELPKHAIQPPVEVPTADLDALWEHGGFPEPFLRRNSHFSRRWRAQRQARLSREDLRQVADVRDQGTIEALIHILAERSGQQLVYANLAAELQVGIGTVRRWVQMLERTQYGFLVRPWSEGIPKALRKEPKWFLRDWGGLPDENARAETLVACHLLKAVETWTDLRFGEYELRYLRDKMKREVDFLVVRDGKPWLLVEVKLTDTTIAPSLAYFHSITGAPRAFQLVMHLPFKFLDPFTLDHPAAVPAWTFLSQLP